MRPVIAGSVTVPNARKVEVAGEWTETRQSVRAEAAATQTDMARLLSRRAASEPAATGAVSPAGEHVLRLMRRREDG